MNFVIKQDIVFACLPSVGRAEREVSKSYPIKYPVIAFAS